MSQYVLENCKLYLGGFNLSGDMNQLNLAYQAQLRDNTTFGNSSIRRIPGLLDYNFNHNGLWNGGDNEVDDVLFGKIGVLDEIMSVYPETGAVGENGFAMKSITAEYAPGAAVGEVFAFTVSGQGSASKLVRTTLMETGAKNATANGTARQLGAVTASQKLYAMAHVVAVSGTNPTLDLVVESDDAEGMLLTTQRTSFTQFTDIGAEWKEVSGAITDDWWRFGWTIGGTDTPTFTVVLALAIQ